MKKTLLAVLAASAVYAMPTMASVGAIQISGSFEVPQSGWDIQFKEMSPELNKSDLSIQGDANNWMSTISDGPVSIITAATTNQTPGITPIVTITLGNGTPYQVNEQHSAPASWSVNATVDGQSNGTVSGRFYTQNYGVIKWANGGPIEVLRGVTDNGLNGSLVDGTVLQEDFTNWASTYAGGIPTKETNMGQQAWSDSRMQGSFGFTGYVDQVKYNSNEQVKPSGNMSATLNVTVQVS